MFTEVIPSEVAPPGPAFAHKKKPRKNPWPFVWEGGLVPPPELSDPLYFLQSRRLALQTTQVIQLRPTHLCRADDLNLIDDLGVQGEDALYALSEADLADGEARLQSAALFDHGAFEYLHALFVAFFDLHVHTDGVARRERRQVAAADLAD